MPFSFKHQLLFSVHHGFVLIGLSTCMLLGSEILQTKITAQDGTPETRSTYVLGPDDLVSIHSLQAEEISDKPIRIDSNGFVTIPMIGKVRAGDRTLDEFETDLVTKLKAFYLKPEVAVTITESRSQPVSVIGSINNPGVHQLQGRKTVLEVLSLAGGVRPDAGPVLVITRSREWGKIPLASSRENLNGDFFVAEINLKKLLAAENPGENITVRPHDVLSIPKAGLVYVVGEVKKSGGFMLGAHTNVSVLEALALAEGLQPRAAPSQARILRARSEGGSSRTEVPVNIQDILAGKSSDISLEADDILFIPNSLTKSIALRTLETAIQIGTGVAVFHR